MFFGPWLVLGLLWFPVIDYLLYLQGLVYRARLGFCLRFGRLRFRPSLELTQIFLTPPLDESRLFKLQIRRKFSRQSFLVFLALLFLKLACTECQTHGTLPNRVPPWLGCKLGALLNGWTRTAALPARR